MTVWSESGTLPPITIPPLETVGLFVLECPCIHLQRESNVNQPSSMLPPPTKPVHYTSLWSNLKIIPVVMILTLLACLGEIVVPGPLSDNKAVVIPHGAGPREVASLLESNGAIYCPFLFRVAAKLLANNAFKAGEYNLTSGISPVDILLMIHNGHSVVRMFTVAEGLTSHEVAKLLNEVPVLTGDNVPVPPEGSLLPETYRYMYGDTRASIMVRMQKSMQDDLTDAWAKRDPNVPISTPEQALVMASIIEKETGKPVERPRIAGVFYNRIHHSMRLQSDPTVIYGIMVANGQMDHPIEHADLSFESPYNTYTNDGLPPKPICNPGHAALEAALHPEWNEFLYFVADGSGGHAFAKTLAEHNQNVTKWNELQATKK